MDKKRKWPLIPLAIILIVLAVTLMTRIYKGASVSNILKRAWEQEELIIRVHMDSPIAFDDAFFSWDTIGNERYYTVNIQEQTIFLHNDALYFSNGNGYSLEHLMSQFTIPDSLKWILPHLVSWEHDQVDGYDVWKLSIPDKPGFLVNKLIPEANQYWNQLKAFTIGLYEQEGALRYIFLQNKSLSLYLEVQYEEPKPILTELVMQMGTGTLPDITTLEPLLRSCMAWYQEQTIYGDLNIQVDCGPLPIEEQATLKLASDGLYLERENTWTPLTGDVTSRQELVLALGGMLLRDGNWNRTDENSGNTTITVSGEKILSAIYSMIPELEGTGLSLEDGVLTFDVRDNLFYSVSLTADGELTFLVLTVPLSLQLELNIRR